MPPRSRLAAAARQLEPLRQGDLDSLCGLYAIINAVQLVLYPLSLRRSQRVSLFVAGIGELQRMRKLRSSITEGMYEPSWRRLAEAVVAKATELTGMPLQLERLSPLGKQPGASVNAIKSSVRRGVPVIVLLDGILCHWTVVARFSSSRLVLFDSLGHRWVVVASIGVSDGWTRHSIAPRGLVTLRPG